MEAVYDVLILGGGPAGCTAALYCARDGLSALVLEKLSAGGQLAVTPWVENYPGFEAGIEGMDLAERLRRQAEAAGAGFVLAEARSADLSGPVKLVETDAGLFRGRCLIAATGAGPKKLALPEAAAWEGRGVHYCAVCDGRAYRGKITAVVGGGNAAAAEALTLSRLCERVYLIHRRDFLRAEGTAGEALERAGNVTFCWNSRVSALRTDRRFLGVLLQDVQTGETRPLDCDGLFVSIGRTPNTALFGGALPLDDRGYLLAGETTETGCPGVFAAGDVRAKPLRQLVTAAADGAAAARAASSYLSSLG